MISNISGFQNVALGSQSLFNNTDGFSNVAQGFNSLFTNSSGSNNIAIGSSSAYSNSDGSNNVSIGSLTLYFNQSGNNNVSIGAFSGENNTGSGNVFLGYKAGQLETGNASNKLYIDNKGVNKSGALIYGEFDSEYVRMNANLEVYKSSAETPAIKGIHDYGVSQFSDVAGIYGENKVDPEFGIGVHGNGNYLGVRGEGQIQGLRGDSYSTIYNGYGVGGNAVSNNPNNANFGIYGVAQNGLVNYSIYGDNPGSGSDDWAGYFNGKVKVVDLMNVDELNVENSATTSSLTTGNIEFSDGNSVNKVTKIKYIIAVSGTFPSQGGGSISDNVLLGEVRMFAGNFAPNGWMFCEGQTLDIASNSALFSLLGATYGGNGTTTFQLPDFREAVAAQR